MSVLPQGVLPQTARYGSARLGVARYAADLATPLSPLGSTALSPPPDPPRGLADGALAYVRGSAELLQLAAAIKPFSRQLWPSGEFPVGPRAETLLSVPPNFAPRIPQVVTAPFAQTHWPLGEFPVGPRAETLISSVPNLILQAVAATVVYRAAVKANIPAPVSFADGWIPPPNVLATLLTPPVSPPPTVPRIQLFQEPVRVDAQLAAPRNLVIGLPTKPFNSRAETLLPPALVTTTPDLTIPLPPNLLIKAAPLSIPFRKTDWPLAPVSPTPTVELLVGIAPNLVVELPAPPAPIIPVQFKDPMNFVQRGNEWFAPPNITLTTLGLPTTPPVLPVQFKDPMNVIRRVNEWDVPPNLALTTLSLVPVAPTVSRLVWPTPRPINIETGVFIAPNNTIILVPPAPPPPPPPPFFGPYISELSQTGVGNGTVDDFTQFPEDWVPSGTTPTWFFGPLVDTGGNVIAPDQLTTLTLTIIDTDDPTKVIVTRANCLNDGRGKINQSSIVAITLLPTDTALFDPCDAREYRTLVLSWTYANGLAAGRHQVNFMIIQTARAT